MDSRGRIWVFRVNTATEFADIFANSVYIGQVNIPCSYGSTSVALRDSALALLCLTDKTDTGGSLRLFRILG
jgi:hypothetical protein